MWLLELAAVRAERGCFVLTSHPFLSGRPARAAALGDIMAEAVSAGDVWITTMAEVAAPARHQRLRPRTLRPPVSGQDR